MNQKTNLLTDEQLREARRVWQRLSPDERNAIRKFLLYLDSGQVKDVRENLLSIALAQKAGKT